jgi:Ca2+-binding RTX toxin-like protein
MTNIATMTLSTPATSVPSLSPISTIDMSTRLGRAVIQGDSQDNTITGTSNNDNLYGGNGNDILYGLGGADRLYGGKGDDVYIIDELDYIEESDSYDGGYDTVVAGFDYTLGFGFEVLELSGTGNIYGFGNAVNNLIIANAGYNRLYGGGGIDTLSYIKATAGVTIGLAVNGIQETGGSGSDIIAEFEHLTGSQFDDVLTGSAFDNIINGLAGDDRLYGGTGNDTLDGGLGVDQMVGGSGNDTYVVDRPTDILIEIDAEGIDTVQSSARDYVLAQFVENLKLAFNGGSINGTGNNLDNLIDGNFSANILNGKEGNDIIYGSSGNDQLIGEGGNDMLYGGNNNDQLMGGVGADFLDGELGDDDLKGESGNDILYGGGGNDVLDGGIGLDLMVGGSGDDVYTRNNSGDMIEELASGGTDTVYSSIHYTLDAYIENAVLLGDRNLNLKGTIFANTLTGNQGQNILDGGAGADYLQGGLGNDIYKMGRGYGIDTIIENDNTTANRDQLRFSQNVAADQLWFTQVGNNLEVSIIGTNDKVVVQDWYLGTAYRTEQLLSGEGKTLRDANVQNLVNAMASMTPPPLGQTELSAAQHSQLDGVIAANWV